MMAVNVWPRFGLRASPFFNQPLESNPDHPTRPITLFVGREADVKLTMNRVIGSHSSVNVVTGGYGVGKTTFIHFVRYRLGQHDKVIVHSSPLRLTNTSMPETISAEVLRRLVDLVELTSALDRLRRTRSFKSAKETVHRVDRWSGSLALLGFGGGLEKTTKEPPIPIHDVVTMAYDLSESIVRIDDSIKMVLHIDNLENLYGPSDAQRARILFRDIRDLLQLDGVHYLLSGGLDLYRAVIAKEQKVSDVVGLPIILAPLDRDTAWRALELRANHLARKGRRGRVPITPDAFTGLYLAYAGNLRGMFGLAEQVFEGRAPVGVEPLEWDGLSSAAREITVTHLGALLQKADLDYLRTAYEVFGRSEFRQTDLAPHLQMTQPSVSRAMDRWVKEGYIEVVREDPPNKYVRLSGLMLIAFGWNAK